MKTISLPALRAFVAPLFLSGIAALLAPSAGAVSLNKSGLGPPLPCGQYQVRSKMLFEGGKALSADSMEYSFSAQMAEGMGGGECGAATASYQAKIIGRWDGKTKRATETIQHQAPAIGRVTEVVSSCPSNPWVMEDNPDCTLVGVTSDNPRMYSPAIAGPYPVSAYLVGNKVRKDIARLVSWTGSSDFILPPTLAPRIVAADDGVDIDGRFYRRGIDVRGVVQRPGDGSPEWYAKNLKSYDLEVQVRSSGESWLSKIISPSVPADSGAFVLPQDRLFDDPQSGWNVEDFGERGIYRSVRMRTRVHDDTIVRPWSNWRSVQVEVPLRFTKAPVSPPPKIPDIMPKPGSAGPAPAPVPLQKPTPGPLR